MRVSTRPARSARRGYVLFAVLLVTVVLSLTAYRFTDSMVTEHTVAARGADHAQARMNAISGVHYAAGVLGDWDMMKSLKFDVSNNEGLFANQSVGARGKFTLVNVSEAPDGSGTGEARYPLRYGIIDEGGKININALIIKDPTGEVLKAALMTLPLPANYPFTIDEISDCIVDWVDSDSTARPNGQEDYSGAGPGYQCKNGPLNSLDELLLVQGVTPQLLYGSDRNRNGKMDAGEDSSGDFSRGWSEYLTCYGRELNVDSEGKTRLNLNGTDIATLSNSLTTLVGQELSDYIVYYRIQGGTTASPMLNPMTQVAAPVSDLRDLVQKAVDSNQKLSRKVASVITVFNTQITLPTPPPMITSGPRGMTVTISPTPIVACPLNDPNELKNKLALLLDKCTAEDGYEIAPRVNVNTAPLSVLTALPGLTADDVNTLISSRTGQDLSDPAVSTGAWLVTVAGMTPDKFKALEPYIGGRSWTYRVHSVGYATANGGQRSPVARMEAVIDVGQRTTDGNFDGLPRIVSFRDLTDLGRGFADLPGSQ